MPLNDVTTKQMDIAVAAQREGHDWIAFKRQSSKPKLATHNAQLALIGNIVTVRGPNELPTRTTPQHVDAPPASKLPAPPGRFKTPASIVPESEMLEILPEMSGYQAWCCGFANRLPDGSVVQTKRNFHLDHLNPVSKAGTSHRITNRAPLCPRHHMRTASLGKWLPKRTSRPE